MHHATLCLLIRDEPVRQVLLGLKKRGFGKDRYNGLGGKPEPGETIIDAAVRELREEAQVLTTPERLTKYAELEFRFPGVPAEKDWDQTVHVYVAYSWSGEPKETDEMKPEWIDTDKIPYSKMWEADRHWIQYIIEGKYVTARFTYSAKQELMEKDVAVSESPGWK